MNDTLAVYYATMTGNSEDLANKSIDRLTEAGYATELINLGDVTPDDLKDYSPSLFVVSTWGEGEPPDEAYDFYDDFVESDVDLSTLHYSVMGLGDTSYDEFNAFARNLDNLLSEKGASSFRDRIEADVDFDDDFEQWISEVLEKLPQLAPSS